jgi:hypothetical protein
MPIWEYVKSRVANERIEGGLVNFFSFVDVDRRTFPSRPELKRRAGSFRDAPFAKVSARLFHVLILEVPDISGSRYLGADGVHHLAQVLDDRLGEGGSLTQVGVDGGVALGHGRVSAMTAAAGQPDQ